LFSETAKQCQFFGFVVVNNTVMILTIMIKKLLVLQSFFWITKLNGYWKLKPSRHQL